MRKSQHHDGWRFDDAATDLRALIDNSDDLRSDTFLTHTTTTAMAHRVSTVAVVPPTAQSDVDRTIDGIATGNILTGAGTLTGAAGKDFGGTGAHTVTAGTFHLILGDLTLAADGSYSYQRIAGLGRVPTGAVETYTYDFTDSKGVVSNTATLSILLNPAETPTIDAKHDTATGSIYDETMISADSALKLSGSGGMTFFLPIARAVSWMEVPGTTFFSVVPAMML